MPGKSEIIVEWLNSKYKGKRSRVNVMHIVVDRKHWRRNDLYFGGGGWGAHSISCAIHVQYNNLINI